MHWREIHRCKLAAPIDFQFEFEPVALIQGRHASAFDRTDMHERIGLAVIALNEAEALHRVEELDRAGCLFPGQLTLWSAGAAGTTTGGTRASVTIARRAAVLDGHWLAINFQISRRNAATTINEREAQGLTLGQTGQPGLLDSTDVHEHIFAAIIANNKAKALLPVEEFDDAGAFPNNLGGHAATAATATGAAKAAAAAAAEPTAAAAEAIATATEAIAATAKAITATTESVTATKAAVETAFAKTIALVFAAPAAIPAAPFIETHALFVFPVRP